MPRRKSRRGIDAPASPTTPNSAFASVLSNEVLDVTQIREGQYTDSSTVSPPRPSRKGRGGGRDRYDISHNHTNDSHSHTFGTMTSIDESEVTPIGSLETDEASEEEEEDDDVTESSSEASSTAFSATSYSETSASVRYESDDIAQEDDHDEDEDADTAYLDLQATQSKLSAAPDSYPFIDTWVDSTCGWLDRQTMCVNFVTGGTGKEASLLRESQLNTHAIQPKRIEGIKTTDIVSVAANIAEEKKSQRKTRLASLDATKDEWGDIVVTASTDPKHHNTNDRKVHKKKQVHSWKNRIRNMRSEETVTSASSKSGHHSRRLKLNRMAEDDGDEGEEVLTVGSDASQSVSEGEHESADEVEPVEDDFIYNVEELEPAGVDGSEGNTDNIEVDQYGNPNDSIRNDVSEQTDGDEEDTENGMDADDGMMANAEAANEDQANADQTGAKDMLDDILDDNMYISESSATTGPNGEVADNNEGNIATAGGIPENKSHHSERASVHGSVRSEHSSNVSITDLTHMSDVELPAHPSRSSSPMKASVQEQGGTTPQGTMMEVLDVGGQITLSPSSRGRDPSPSKSQRGAAPMRSDPPAEEAQVSNFWEGEEAKIGQFPNSPRLADNEEGNIESSDDDEGANHGVSDLASRASKLWAEEEQKVNQKHGEIEEGDTSEYHRGRPSDVSHTGSRSKSLNIPRSNSKSERAHNRAADDSFVDSVRSRDSRYKDQPRPETMEAKPRQLRQQGKSKEENLSESSTMNQGQVVYDFPTPRSPRHGYSPRHNDNGRGPQEMNLGHRQMALGLNEGVLPGMSQVDGHEDERTRHSVASSRRRSRSHDLRTQNVEAGDEEHQDTAGRSVASPNQHSRRSKSQDLRHRHAEEFANHDDVVSRHSQSHLGREEQETRQLRKSKSARGTESKQRFDTPKPVHRKSKSQDLRNADIDDFDASAAEQNMRRSMSRESRDSQFVDARGQEAPSSPRSRASRMSGSINHDNGYPETRSPGILSGDETYGQGPHDTRRREMRSAVAARRSAQEKGVETGATHYDMPDPVVRPSRSRDSRRETSYDVPELVVPQSRSRDLRASRSQDLREEQDIRTTRSRGSLRETASRDASQYMTAPTRSQELRESRSRELEYSMRPSKSRELRDARSRNQPYGVRNGANRIDLSRREAEDYSARHPGSRNQQRYGSQEESETIDYSLRSPRSLGVRQSYNGVQELGGSSRGFPNPGSEIHEIGIRNSKSRESRPQARESRDYGVRQPQTQRYDEEGYVSQRPKSSDYRGSNYEDVDSVEHGIRKTRSRGMRGEPINIEDYEIRNAKSRESRRSNRLAVEDEFDRYREERDDKSRGSRKSKGSKANLSDEQLVAAKELRKLEKKLEKQLRSLNRDKDDRSRTSTDLRHIEKQLVRKLKREDEKRASRLKRLRKKDGGLLKPSPDVSVYKPPSIQDRVRADHEIQTITQKAEELREQAKEARSRAMGGVSSSNNNPGATKPTTGFYTPKPNRTRRQQLDQLRSGLRGKDF